MAQKPYFSVIIPTFNRKQFCVEAVNSVLAQTFGDFEILICDDGSVDDTKSHFSSQTDGRIKYFYQANAGVSTARNLGVCNANGKYICYLDSDDLWAPTKLEETKTFIERNLDVDVIFTDFRKHNVSLAEPYPVTNTDIFPYLLNTFKRRNDTDWTSHELDAFYLAMRGYPFYPSTFTLNSEIHKNYRWDPGVLKSEDFNLFLKLALRYKFGYLHKDLTTIRVHDSNKSADTITKDRIVLQTMELVTKLYCKGETQKSASRILISKYFYTGISQVKQGNYRLGFAWAIKALLNPYFYVQKLKNLIN